MLKQGAANLAALNTVIATATSSLLDTSTDAEVQAAIDSWNTARGAYADYGQIRLPDLATLNSDILGDIAAAAVAP